MWMHGVQGNLDLLGQPLMVFPVIGVALAMQHMTSGHICMS